MNAMTRHPVRLALRGGVCGVCTLMTRVDVALILTSLGVGRRVLSSLHTNTKGQRLSYLCSSPRTSGGAADACGEEACLPECDGEARREHHTRPQAHRDAEVVLHKT
jgi:hypothetical protein